MESNQLSGHARAVADAIRSGDIDGAARYLGELRASFSPAHPREDAHAAAEILIEARRFAIVYRAQTIQALQSVVRQQLYRASPPPGRHTFQVDG